MGWVISEDGISKNKVEFLGSKFLIGNGYLGYRGTLEEYGKEQLVACTLSGLYDQNGDKWREPVNAPNAFRVISTFDGEKLSALSTGVLEHQQSLDISCAYHVRKTTFKTSSGKQVEIKSERFVSLDNIHLLAARYEIAANESGKINIRIGIDNDIWDINGPHLSNIHMAHNRNAAYVDAQTIELGSKVTVAQASKCSIGGGKPFITNSMIGKEYEFLIEANSTIVIECYNAIFKSQDGSQNTIDDAIENVMQSRNIGYENLLLNSKRRWSQLWDRVDVQIEGDDEAQLALRYSIYLLLISTPFHTDKVAIPGRGLSGQVYKGAMFWDTEIYMLPMYLYSIPEIGRNLVNYRINTLEGAREKAAEYGYKGAFYAWESQETGRDSCTLYNITDVFTKRPIRTYFRDKQIHISADVAYGIWQYYQISGDESILIDGGAEVILECARFFYSYSYYKPEKKRYELLDVTGSDEYHERVNNDAYTNIMVKFTLDAALWIIDHFKKNYNEKYKELIQKIGFEEDIPNITHMSQRLYIPEPDPVKNVIEQFDGYFNMEDISPDELKKRVIVPNEYLGSPSGLAVNTQVIKQADVVLIDALFSKRYSAVIKKANWRYYEPRTEHGSSLSTCIYALAAADFGDAEWAYKYFMKAATIDLYGDYKLYVGNLYIGGTHPAANGGSWMVAVLGFGGLYADKDRIILNPHLPEKWKKIRFNVVWQGQRFKVTINPDEVIIKSFPDNTKSVEVLINNSVTTCVPGYETVTAYSK